MKKIVLLLLSLVMVLSLVACGKSKDSDVKDDQNQTNSGNENAGDENAGDEAAADVATLELLTTVWGKIADDQKPPVIGGDYENMVDGAAGAVLTRDGETLNGLFAFPADKAELIKEAASMRHMMNANTFTAVAYQFEAGNVDTMVSAIEDSITNNQWICGFPEKLIIVKVGNDVVVAYGAGDIVNPFKDKVAEAYANAAVVVDKSL